VSQPLNSCTSICKKTQSAVICNPNSAKTWQKITHPSQSPKKKPKKLILFLNLTYSSSIIWKKEREMKNSLNPKIANWWGRHELVEDHCRISTPLTSPKMKSMKHKPRNTKNLHTCSMGPHPVFALIALLRLLPPLTWALLSPCSMMLHFLPKTWTPCKPTLKFKPNHPNSPQWQESLINTWHIVPLHHQSSTNSHMSLIKLLGHSSLTTLSPLPSPQTSQTGLAQQRVGKEQLL